jgi:hypothetical protein
MNDDTHSIVLSKKCNFKFQLSNCNIASKRSRCIRLGICTVYCSAIVDASAAQRGSLACCFETLDETVLTDLLRDRTDLLRVVVVVVHFHYLVVGEW